MTDNVDESILFLLKPKGQICFLKYNWSLRQGLEKMKYYGYTAVPVIDCEGKYKGTVTEGDFLWHMLKKGETTVYDAENDHVSDIVRLQFNPAVNAYCGISILVERIMNQNFVPVVDDQNVLMGIITRQDVMKYLKDR